ncbi:hypothetical protein ABU614_15180 [Lysobacter firmicutimachus]|uniref:Lipoprotein n=1 Tax=Lysobacter firmicutimachus TaxID=1792846 RepID=A0AAU8MPZ5_9GAMM
MLEVKTRRGWFAAAVCAAIAIASGCDSELRLQPIALPAGWAQAAYAQTVCVSHRGRPIAGFEIESGELPDGLQLEHARGEDCARLEGRPARPGRYRFTVAASEYGTMLSGRHGKVAYVLDIAPPQGQTRADAGRTR